MGGIELEDGGNEEGDDPLIIYIGDIVDLAHAEHVAHAGEHQQGGEQEQEVADEHHPAQPTDDKARALVALEELHRREGEGSDGVDIGRRFPRQDTRTGTNDHQDGSEEEDQVLRLTQLSHRWLRGLGHCRSRSTRRYLRRRPS